MGFDFFTTTLSISPKKDEQVLNVVAKEQGAIYGIKALPADFKRKGGFNRSVELSEEYCLYRQEYCGCVYSLREYEERIKKQNEDK
jgi:hypothetical protein